jgi:uncharacterized OB-fold protein
MTGTVYTETLIHAAPREFLAEAPYQLVIVTLEDGTRKTGRVLPGVRLAIGDRVETAEERNGIPYFRKI